MAVTQYGVGIEIDSFARIERTRRLLRQLAPECLAAVDAKLKQAGGEVTGEANSRIATLAETHGTASPRSAGSYRTQVNAKGIRITTRARGAAIIEFAGKLNPTGKTERGRSLIATLNDRYGEPGRIIWAAWDERSEGTMAAIQEIVIEAEKALQAAIEGKRVG